MITDCNVKGQGYHEHLVQAIGIFQSGMNVIIMSPPAEMERQLNRWTECGPAVLFKTLEFWKIPHASLYGHGFGCALAMRTMLIAPHRFKERTHIFMTPRWPHDYPAND